MASLPAPVVRPARPEELEAVFLLGYDAWGGGAPIERYLEECRSSTKYARGRWTVLTVGGAVAGAVVVYRDVFGLPAGAWGAGSVCVDAAVRRLGLGKALMKAVLAREAGTAFLWADALPGFYEGLGFAPLPERHQTRPGSIAMARGAYDEASLSLAYF